MLEVNFYLKSVSPNKKGQKPVIAQVGLNYKKIRKTIFKCKPSEWNKKKQCLILPDSDAADYKKLLGVNEEIERYKSAIRNLDIKALSEKRNVSESEIRDILNLDLKGNEDKLKVSFFEMFDEYIKFRKATKAENTAKGDNTVRNFLEIFEKTTDFKLTFNSIDIVFADKLQEYCFTKVKIDNDYFVKIANVLKRYMKWAAKRGFYDIDKFPNEELLSIKEKENDVIFLTLEELMVLHKWDFKSQRLSQARDMFCFAAFTGFRHSDAYTLLRENINDRMISKMEKKTKKLTKIPINKYAKEILDKYIDEVSPLKQISNQKANDYIKECCKEIVDNHPEEDIFRRKVVKLHICGAEVSSEIKPLYKAITFHIARKTFITNSLMLGVNLQALQEMGAPKKPQHLKKYLKITDAFKSQVMKNTWDKI